MLQVEIHSPKLEKEVNALIEAGLYGDTSALITDALETLLQVKKESRLDAAIRLYQQKAVTLGKAAELAGLHRFEFEATLKEKGIEKIVAEASAAEVRTGVSFIKQLHEQSDSQKPTAEGT